MVMQRTKLRCPYCGCETPQEYETDICCSCGTVMVEWKECKCCEEYTIPGDEYEDFCDKCKGNVQKKLYDFLKENCSETEIDVLDAVVDESFYRFMKGYEEEHEIE